MLHITDGLLNDSLIDAIVKCKKLTSLKLCSMPSVHNRFLAELATLPELNDFHISKCQTLNATGVVQFANLARKLKTLHISNSSVEIDDSFVQSLVTIYKQRGTRLTLSLNKMPIKVSPGVLDENRRYVEIVRPSDYYLYDVFGDGLSEIDSDDDDDDDDDDGITKIDNGIPRFKILTKNRRLFFFQIRTMAAGTIGMTAMKIYSMMMIICPICSISIQTCGISSSIEGKRQRK